MHRAGSSLPLKTRCSWFPQTLQRTSPSPLLLSNHGKVPASLSAAAAPHHSLCWQHCITLCAGSTASLSALAAPPTWCSP
eukprot:363864-Chlamydomonas_euryale.AAC.6